MQGSDCSGDKGQVQTSAECAIFCNLHISQDLSEIIFGAQETFLLINLQLTSEQ